MRNDSTSEFRDETPKERQQDGGCQAWGQGPGCWWWVQFVLQTGRWVAQQCLCFMSLTCARNTAFTRTKRSPQRGYEQSGDRETLGGV